MLNSAPIAPITLGSIHQLGISYLGGTSFSFTYDGLVMGPVDANAGSSVPFLNPAWQPLIGTKHVDLGPNDCATVEATFDNVYINGILYETFDAPLDPMRWQIGYFSVEATHTLNDTKNAKLQIFGIGKRVN